MTSRIYEGKKYYYTDTHKRKHELEQILIKAVTSRKINGRAISEVEITRIDTCLSRYYPDTVNCEKAIVEFLKIIRDHWAQKN
jgi:hypothetical protein